jgi:hypothetical protein
MNLTHIDKFGVVHPILYIETSQNYIFTLDFKFLCKYLILSTRLHGVTSHKRVGVDIFKMKYIKTSVTEYKEQVCWLLFYITTLCET